MSSATAAPAGRPLGVPALGGQRHAPVDGHPAHDLGGGELLGLPPDLPDALVGVVAVADGVVDQAGHALPDRGGDLRAGPPQLGVDGVEEHPPHVELLLVEGAVAHPDRLRSPVAREVVQGPLGEVPLPADAVHDLERELLRLLPGGHGVEHEGEVLNGLPVEAQLVERAQHERRIADPGVAVVPVPLPARGLRQRGGGGGHDGPGRGVAQPLQGEGAPLDVLVPGVVGHPGRAQPVPPVADGEVAGGLRGLEVGRGARPPRQGDEGRLALLERGPPVGPLADDPETHRTAQLEAEVTGQRSHRHGAVAGAVVLPASVHRAVLEARDAVAQHLDPAVDAGGHAQQRAGGDGVARDPPVVGPPAVEGHPPHHEEVGHHQPAGGCVPRGLEGHGARDVAPVVGDDGARGPEAERAGGAVQEGPEDARGVGARAGRATRPRHSERRGR